MVMNRPLTVMAAACALTACLASPTYLKLNPTVQTTGTGVGGDRPVALTCLDERPERRGGIAAGSYLIEPGLDVASAVCRSTATALQRMGFAPTIGQASQAATLQIAVTRIAHAIGGNNVKREVEVEAEIRATAAAGGREYTTRYRAQRMREVAFSPRLETVQELSDETVSAALSRTLADPAILAMLTGGGGGGGMAPATNDPDTQTYPYP